MAKYDFNIAVIGGGSAGLVTSYIGAALKAKTLLIEKNKMGGDCLNTGCVPSKALIRTASVISQIRRHKEFGIKDADCTFTFSEIMDRVQRVIKKIEPHDSVERYTSLGVTCLRGEAGLVSPHEINVDGKKYTARNIVIASGAKPFIPPIPGLEKVDFLHTDNLWELKELPEKLVVLGGGPIGCELGQCFARFGSQVTQVEMAPQILIREDDEVIRYVEDSLRKDGLNIAVSTRAVRIESESGRHQLIVESNGTERAIEFDRILIAVGRKARTEGFGLENIGVKLTDRGLIAVDAFNRTSVPNIYACGDAASLYQFTHTAAHGAWYCAVNSLFSPLKKFKTDWSIVPWCTYTDPEVARVGLNEKDANAAGIKYEVALYPLDDLDRAITDEEDKGVVKVLTVPGKDTILGVTICGHHAGNMLPGFVYAMKYGIGLNKILGSIHVYPSMGELNKYVAGVWKKAHAPEWALNLLQKFHEMRR
ncbi:MAG: FAD-dependent oxidoreductase [Candidatus Omnitrophica bacterium]|nr:FAD-dependent oxidoreductase [Candidatus Omnitrophota bacterium]